MATTFDFQDWKGHIRETIIDHNTSPFTLQGTADMSHLQDVAMQAAETIQTAHIKHRPSIEQDRAPSTAADTKEPVVLDHDPDLDTISELDEDEIPVSLLRPPRRRPQMPPLPDLRFEQSYLASIKDTQGWMGVTYITMRDQVCAMRSTITIVERANISKQVLMPLVQGVAWTLAVAGWRHLNRASKLSGHGIGAKVRRWWWGVNNWKLPEESGLRNEKLAGDAAEFYKGAANAGSD